MQLDPELITKLKQEIYDKLPKHRKDTDVSDYNVKISGIGIDVTESLYIEIEEVERE